MRCLNCGYIASNGYTALCPICNSPMLIWSQPLLVDSARTLPSETGDVEPNSAPPSPGIIPGLDYSASQNKISRPFISYRQQAAGSPSLANNHAYNTQPLYPNLSHGPPYSHSSPWNPLRPNAKSFISGAPVAMRSLGVADSLTDTPNLDEMEQTDYPNSTYLSPEKLKEPSKTAAISSGVHTVYHVKHHQGDIFYHGDISNQPPTSGGSLSYGDSRELLTTICCDGIHADIQPGNRNRK